MNKSEHTLRRLEQNDSTLMQLQIGGRPRLLTTPGWTPPAMFNSTNSGDFSRLGDYIGENTHLKHLDVQHAVGLNLTNDGFFDGLKRNTSIHMLGIDFRRQSIEESGLGIKMLDAYQENSNHLTWLRISSAGLQNGGENVITTTLRRCTNLQEISLSCCNINDEQLLQNIVEAVREHRSLKKFGLFANRIGNAQCSVLANLLEDKKCNLQILDLKLNRIGLDGATTLATNGLLNNTKLEHLYLDGNPMDNQSGVDIFSEVLCNTSSINDTYSSNHTLQRLSLPQHGLDELFSLLKMNKGKNKRHVDIY